MNLRLAIISDLHCHPTKENYRDNNTYLLTDKLRSPKNDHPVASLLEIIKDNKIQTDLILCPGDFTDNCDKQGFISGWGFLQEISRNLKAGEIYATLGNHDVDSRHLNSTYSFENAKSIGQDFPFTNEDNVKDFWANGFTFFEEKNCQILVINSCHYHHYKDVSGQGKIEINQIEQIEKYLKSNKTDKIKIAMCHHHPIQHSRLKLGSDDFIQNGEELLKVLGNFKYDLVIHGHKHDPWLRNYISEGGHKIPIFSSGSFSSTSNLMWTSKRNTFHIIEIEKSSSSPACGQLMTWTFMPNNGWEIFYDKGGFHPYSGFGNALHINNIVEKIKDIVGNNQIFKWEDVLAQIKEINYLVPDEIDELSTQLKLYDFLLSPELPMKPILISKLS